MTSASFLLNAVLSLLAASAAAALQDSRNSLSPQQSVAPLFPSLIDATLTDLAAGLESGTFTSVDLVQTYIARIEETNDVLHAVTEINPDALTIAASLDAARRDGRVFGPLHGIPVLIKNNIATSDKMNNTAGSYALLGATVPYDSTVAAKLRKAGAVILGKSNLSQWSDARSENSSSGWSAHGGQTQGAYHPAQSPCGSSAGSGVAASLGLAWAALGTETSGSIQCPACYNNVVGSKWSSGLGSCAVKRQKPRPHCNFVPRSLEPTLGWIIANSGSSQAYCGTHLAASCDTNFRAPRHRGTTCADRGGCSFSAPGYCGQRQI